MTIETLNNFFQELKNDEMSLLYSGDFSDEVTSQVIGLSGAQFDDGSDLNKVQKKTGFLIAECFQNIVRHNESSIENGFFLIRNDEGILYIASGNIVTNNMIVTLSDKLDHLNTLSKEELKEIYISTLRDNTISEKGGAGLGLIEMARKTGNKLDYEFVKIDAEISFFYFQLKYKVEIASDGIPADDLSLGKSIELRKKLIENDIFLVYQGDVSMNTVLPIIHMVEKSLGSQDIGLRHEKKVMITLMEMLQNMSKHSLTVNSRKDGIFLIGERDGAFVIGGSNKISDSNQQSLKDKFTDYNGRSHDELNNLYKEILKNGDPKNKNGASLGIIEMLRRSGKPAEYSFTKDNEHSVFNLLLQI